MNDEQEESVKRIRKACEDILQTSKRIKEIDNKINQRVNLIRSTGVMTSSDLFILPLIVNRI